jgi:hypothetical protein
VKKEEKEERKKTNRRAEGIGDEEKNSEEMAIRKNHGANVPVSQGRQKNT